MSNSFTIFNIFTSHQYIYNIIYLKTDISSALRMNGSFGKIVINSQLGYDILIILQEILLVKWLI